MHHLPPPNWNLPPSHLNGGIFVPNMQSVQGSCASFMPGLNPNFQQRNPSFEPRAPLHGSYTNNNNQQSNSKREQHEKSCDIESRNSAQEFYCDVCERFFNTRQNLDTHLATHVKCEQEGCSFQASRKVLKLHYIQNHAEGRMRIVLETPEQIEKWREERRKKYPTVANVEKKLIEEKEKTEKGQVAQNRTHRYRGKHQRFHNHHKRGPHYRNKKNFSNQNENQYQNKNEQNGQSVSHQSGRESVKTEKNNQFQEGDPLSLVLMSDDDSDCEDSKVVTSKQMTAVKEAESMRDPTPDSTSALMSLCASYGDISSDEDTKPDEINNNDKEDKTNTDKSNNCSAVNVNLKTQVPKSSERRKRYREKGPHKGVVKQAKRKPTLLEKLLAPEIRHESNLILQCIRYIVKKNFFDVVPEDVVISPSSPPFS